MDSSEHSAIKSQLLEVWEKLRQAVDTDGDQKVTLDEFLQFAESAGNNLIEDVFVKTADMVFDLADTDGDGNISFDESKSFFLLFESSLSSAQEAFSQIDKDNDGTITKEENRELVRSAFS
jgi:Ca2+-binding EF-hand superfamily protein